MTTPTRLFTPTGTTTTPADRALLRDVQRMVGPAEIALGELAAALNNDDVDRAVAGARRLFSVGWILMAAVGSASTLGGRL